MHSCTGRADCPCYCGLNAHRYLLYLSRVSLRVFGPISLIYSNWPMALYWFPVSHGEPDRQAAHVSSPPGEITWHTSPHNTLCLWMHGCVCCARLWTHVTANCFSSGKVIDICFIWLWEQTLLICWRFTGVCEDVLGECDWDLCFCRFFFYAGDKRED